VPDARLTMIFGAVLMLGLLAYGVFCFFDARYHRV
jgi:hypothetical protein